MGRRSGSKWFQVAQPAQQSRTHPPTVHPPTCERKRRALRFFLGSCRNNASSMPWNGPCVMRMSRAMKPTAADERARRQVREKAGGGWWEAAGGSGERWPGSSGSSDPPSAHSSLSPLCNDLTECRHDVGRSPQEGIQTRRPEQAVQHDGKLIEMGDTLLMDLCRDACLDDHLAAPAVATRPRAMPRRSSDRCPVREKR